MVDSTFYFFLPPFFFFFGSSGSCSAFSLSLMPVIWCVKLANKAYSSALQQ